jgi:hypothetical protein
VNNEDFNMDEFLNEGLKPEVPLVSVDSRRNPNDPARTLTEDDFADVAWVGDAMRERRATAALVDNDALLVEIAGLNAKDEAAFDAYCEKFQTSILPRGAAAWFKVQTETVKMAWLYARWINMKKHLRLSTFAHVALLDSDRLARALQCVLENPATPLSELPGFGLNPKQQSQVRRTVLGSPELSKIFIEVVERFRSEELVNAAL